MPADRWRDSRGDFRRDWRTRSRCRRSPSAGAPARRPAGLRPRCRAVHGRSASAAAVVPSPAGARVPPVPAPTRSRLRRRLPAAWHQRLRASAARPPSDPAAAHRAPGVRAVAQLPPPVRRAPAAARCHRSMRTRHRSHRLPAARRAYDGAAVRPPAPASERALSASRAAHQPGGRPAAGRPGSRSRSGSPSSRVPDRRCQPVPAAARWRRPRRLRPAGAVR